MAITLEARQFIPDSDYPVVSEWWEAHGWPSVPKYLLPKCGIVVEGNGVMMAAAFLFMDNSVGVAMMEWTVTNPENKPRESMAAIGHLIGAIKETAKLFDYGFVLTSAKQEALIRLYEHNGFLKTDAGMTHLLMTVSPE